MLSSVLSSKSKRGNIDEILKEQRDILEWVEKIDSVVGKETQGEKMKRIEAMIDSTLSPKKIEEEDEV